MIDLREVPLPSDPSFPQIPRPPALPRLPGASPGPLSDRPPPASTKSTELFYRLAELQVTRPAIPLVIAGLLAAVAVLLATRLVILTGFESLLPESRRSVQELNRVAARTAGVSTLFIAL
jgi:uncharacterized protein